MKKATWLLLCGVLTLCACQKDPVPETPSKDAELTGEKVDLTRFKTTARKVFVLNEGSMGTNSSTLDFLRISDGTYVTGAFKKMNPDAEAGLGDVGNDIAVHGDEVWIVVNNSGVVEVLSAKDETEIAAIAVPTPRNIAFDETYAYVSSWAGAYFGGITNPNGKVYRINLSTRKVEGSVEVGLQPEGLACYGGKLYVANSGGISSTLPPDYAYDNTISIIDTRTFQVTKTVVGQINQKDVYSDGTGNIYITTLGNYADVHSGLYMLKAEEPANVMHIGDYVKVSALCGDTVYCIGMTTEFDWTVTSHQYKAWSVKDGRRGDLLLNVSAQSLYSLTVLNANTFLVGDAGDYMNPGQVSCYHNNEKIWSVTAGICPGHFAVY